MRWQDFEQAAPAIAHVGKGLLYNPSQGEVGLIATVDASARPRIAPVCPIFCDGGIYLSVGAHTPKLRHLQLNKRYALHAQVGADDLEFQISGTVRHVDSVAEQQKVIAAIPFPDYEPGDPIFELLIERALSVTWPEPGAPVKATWDASD